LCARFLPVTESILNYLAASRFQSFGHRLPQFLVGHIQVTLRGLEIGMAEQKLDGAKVQSLGQPAASGLVPKIMPMQIDVAEFSTATFSLVNALLLRPLPVVGPQDLVELGSETPHGPGNFSYPLYEGVRDQNSTFSNVAAVSSPVVRADDNGSDQPPLGRYVSGNFFEALDAGRVLSSFATRSSPRASVRRPNGFEDERVVGTGRLAEYRANLFDLDRDRAGAVSDRNVERVAPRRRIEHVGGEEQIAVLQFPGAAWRHRITPRVIDRHRLGHR
jgi:hypothetical protein